MEKKNLLSQRKAKRQIKPNKNNKIEVVSSPETKVPVRRGIKFYLFIGIMLVLNGIVYSYWLTNIFDDAPKTPTTQAKNLPNPNKKAKNELPPDWDLPPQNAPIDRGYNTSSGQFPPGALPTGVSLPGITSYNSTMNSMPDPRTMEQGYGVNDGIRQQFTGQQRDTESNLDYYGERYYSSQHGRFTSVDPSYDSVDLENPQSWNRYSYVLNNPLRYTDPTGEVWVDNNGRPEWIDDKKFNEMSNKNMYKLWTQTEYNSTEGRVRLDPLGPNADNPSGFTIIGPNIEAEMNGGAILGTVAVAAADGPQPGPADLLALGIIFGMLGNAATTQQRLLPIVPMMPHIMMNENADATPSNPEPDAGNLSDKVGKIATALGVTEKQVRDAIHKVKRNLRTGGKTRNPDVEVDLNTGEVYPKVPGGGRGDSIGNIWEFLP